MNRQRQCSTQAVQHQRGAVAIIVALCLVVLVGMIGLVVDLGHMFVIKTELQNAADACSLAAARELDGATDALLRAESAGITVGQKNNVDLQAAAVSILPSDVEFSEDMNGPYLSRAAGADPATSKYAMCTLNQPGIVMWFMQVMGFGNQTVAAKAVAALAPSQTTCAIPIGICRQDPGPPPTFGLVVGKWYSGRFGSDHDEPLTGSYNWIDFSPPNGGANELKNLLTGVGQCELPPVGTMVGEQGQVVGVTDAWNSRFGVYKNGGYDIMNAAPDFTGLAYTPDVPASPGPPPVSATLGTWPHADASTPQNAYSGTPDSGSTLNYLAAQTARASYQSTDPAVVGVPNPYHSTSVADHTQFGANRRIVVAPIVDCKLLSGTNPQTVPVLGYECALMLNPISGPNNVVLEARGLASDSSSPCASFGIPGGVAGPLVPVLVQ